MISNVTLPSLMSSLSPLTQKVLKRVNPLGALNRLYVRSDLAVPFKVLYPFSVQNGKFITLFHCVTLRHNV